MSNKHVHIHVSFGGKEPCSEGEPSLAQVMEKLTEMSQAMDDLEREVAETKTAVASTVVLIQGIREQLIAAGVDQTKLAALAADLQSSQDDLAAAATTEPPPA